MAAESNQHRRYIGGKENMSFVLYSSSKFFHINDYENLFIVKVLRLDMYWNSLIALIKGIWDVVNDGMIGAVVDKTATRWGKFRPYLFTYATVGSTMMCLYWCAPLFLSKNPLDPTKLIFWLLFSLVYDIFPTMRDVTEGGMVSAMSPRPDDRVRLYTRADVIAAVWQDLPGIVMGILYDLTKDNETALRSTFAWVGSVTVLVGGVMALALSVYARERIPQSVERHSYRESLRTLVRNKPLLLILVTEFFGGFAAQADNWEYLYYPEVLGSITLRNLIRAPGAPFSFLSYGFLHKARARFSIKSLWMFSQTFKEAMTLLVFAIGSFGGIYKKVAPMVVMLIIRNFFYMGTMSVTKIIPKEITLDAVDYAEWKTGFRSEGALLSTKGMVNKIVKNCAKAMTTFIMKKTGYDQDAAVQSDRSKYALFALSFAIPAALGLLRIIPVLLYDLTGEKRERMFEELKEMRRLRQMEYDQLEEQPAVTLS